MEQQNKKPQPKLREKQHDSKQAKRMQDAVAKGNPKIDGKIIKGYN